MDKQWIKLQSPCRRYVDGVEYFLNYAFSKVESTTSEILCPCQNCYNLLYQDRDTVQWHCIEYGFTLDYTTWVFHGETPPSNSTVNNVQSNRVEDDDVDQEDQMPEMINDLFMNGGDIFGAYGKNFDKYMNSASSPLYPGCKTETTLSFIVWLFNLKCNGKWSDWSFDSLLGKLKEVFPECTNLPGNFYETKKMVGDMGFDYEKIDACPNDCMLYWKEEKELKSCKVCDKPRWKTVRVEKKDDDEMPTKENKVAIKQLRYLPLIPRLQRLFRSLKTTKDMKWHHLRRRKDGVYRHPADSNAWKHFDTMYPTFAEECRNVRLGLSTDGMNPFNNGHYSIWPVQVVIYNLPQWMCLKQEYFIMPLLIPGPCSPSNDIDVYLRPLIEELKTLWMDGVDTYDALTKSVFKMRAALLWTISDFPALANLSGWSTKGKLACPICQGNTRSLSLRSKQCYIGHRCFLPPDHKYRSDKRRFNGDVDYTEAPPIPSGYDVLEQVRGIKVTFGKTKKKTVRHEKSHNWRKKSIFFVLPYWRTLLIRHMLDLMHIEKNVCDNLIGTLLGMKGKSKDTLKARLDLEDMQIRKDLHAKPIGPSSSVYQLPAACYTLSKKEKQSFLEVLKGIKVPDGYSSNISRCVNVKECKIMGLKSHDCHIIMQQLLPIVMRCTPLPEHVKRAIIDLCHYFRELCLNSYREEDYERMKRKIPLILCNLEMVFPPTFFDIMVHLPIHLAEQQRIAGNVKFLNIYPFERSMRKTKGYIRNRSRPEGSIVEGVVVEECLTFCSRYLKDVDATCNRDGRNEDGYDEHGSSNPIFRRIGRFLGTPKISFLDEKDVDMAHLYLLFNCEEVKGYLSIWEKSYMMQQGCRRKVSARDLDNAKKKEFPRWFRDYGKEMELSEEIKALSGGPIRVAHKGTGYLINGFRFHTEMREKKSQTQNSGVYVAATTRGYSSARDSSPREEIVEYFGILEDIIELAYDGDEKIVLFKCRWYNSIARDKGVKTDQYGYTLVNVNKFGSKEEPFVLPSQVEQIFYVDDHRDKDWRVVIRTKPRDMCDSAEAESDDEDITLQSGHSTTTITENEEENYTWVRDNVDPEVVDGSTAGSRTKKRKHNATNRRKVNLIIVDEDEDDEVISEDEEEWADEENGDEAEEVEEDDDKEEEEEE